jgi:hypothetical protein
MKDDRGQETKKVVPGMLHGMPASRYCSPSTQLPRSLQDMVNTMTMDILGGCVIQDAHRIASRHDAGKQQRPDATSTRERVAQ